MSPLVQDLRRTLQGPCRLAPGSPLVVAVSGGADSMALLHALARLPSKQRHPIVVAHLDHQLRGQQSSEDAAFVRDEARRLDLPCCVETIPVRDAAARSREGVETTARHIRHQFLARVAIQHRIQHVALAHHARDQAELFFLRLLRGSSPEGLAGMRHASPSPASPSVTLVRPLLDQSPETLRRWLSAHNLPWREDASNTDTALPRNAIRHELLPVLQRLAGPSSIQVITRTMAILRDESDFIDLHLAGEPTASPDASQIHVALQRRHVVRQLIALGHEPTHDLVQHLASRPRSPRHLPGGHAVVADANATVSASPAPASSPAPAASPVHIRLQPPRGTAPLPGARLAWSITRRHPGPRRLHEPTPDVAWLDAEAVGPSLVLRPWRPGDRFHPLGAPGSAKVGDLFTNRRVPRSERPGRWVAVTRSEVIAWVQGWPCAHPFRITDTTRRFLRIQLQPLRAKARPTNTP